jgi:TPR repeat protein
MTSDQAFALAESAWKQKDATALAQLRAAAQSGDANAQYWLGVMYHNGQGVPQDYAQAISWFRKAAAQGDADAQNRAIHAPMTSRATSYLTPVREKSSCIAPPWLS